MKKLLNTLYITTQGAYLAREGEAVLVRIEEETRLRVPVHTLGGIVCFGRVGASPPLLGLCGESGVAVSFFSERGRFLARVQGPVSGNVLLRREQYRRADDKDDGDGAAAEIARSVVIGKIANARHVLLRGSREASESEAAQALQNAARRLRPALDQLDKPRSLEGLRALEGEAAKIYFEHFDRLIIPAQQAFRFTKRSRRPPLDPMNALLSFLYTLLAHDVAGACEGVGLDPQVGFLHRDRPGRPSLALDLMEELRPMLADRLALTLVNRQQLTPRDFTTSESGGVYLADKARKGVLTAWQQRKQEEIRHPFLDEKIQIGLIPHVQALLLARHLRGDLDGYPPFLWQ